MVTRIDQTPRMVGPAYIVIVLGVPLTVVHRPLRLYEVIGIPLAYPGNNAHTILSGLPQAVMYAHRARYITPYFKRLSPLLRIIHSDWELVVKYCYAVAKAHASFHFWKEIRQKLKSCVNTELSLTFHG